MNEETDEIKISKLLDYDPHLAAQLYKGLGYNFDDFVNQVINWYRIYADLTSYKHKSLEEMHDLERGFNGLLFSSKTYTLEEFIILVDKYYNYLNKKPLIMMLLNKYWK
jgi:hypothetical protein